MKTKLYFFSVLLFSATILWSQENSDSRIPLIGSSAPSFSAKTTKGEISFPGDFGKNWKILFSHPKDFTPVCSSEILELAQRQDEFSKMGVKIVVVSTDTLYQHQNWVLTLDTLNYKGRQPQVIKFPLVDDNSKYVSKLYGMLHNPTSTTKDVRGVFVIDPQNKIRAIFFYPSEVGRNFDEIERTILALQLSDRDHVLTPADWKPGEDVFIPYQTKESKLDPKVYYVAPFMIAKKM
jgi:peroxiredoxin (alkyl hydroperoxide reductase subunit C)